MTHAINLNHDVYRAGRPSFFSRLAQSFAQYRVHLATYSELNALSDRELSDIGLSRVNIREVAQAAVFAS